MAPFVREAIYADPAIARKALRDQFEKLILQPLGRVHHAMEIMIVGDALDECDGDNDVKTIISLLAQAEALRSARLRISPPAGLSCPFASASRTSKESIRTCPAPNTGANHRTRYICILGTRTCKNQG
jgi:hypothetical protein